MKEQENEQVEREHPFDRLMFGNRNEESRNSRPVSRQTTTSQNNFDFGSMLQNVDTIMSSINKFKPVVKQFSPLLDLLKKQK
ncbi:hypothetical protein [Bacillus suaedaesalsae]|uniref:Spore coat protein n=1 Tax=Bacillus suaedaesalsae TaxID=2810349 RepID=A0ABS2DL96_9BACI|nr:hypothetical protein [Bacillus suaedaesalsae]MBM6618296.1 hypothetical protein [Bacillus suaedaesalsae]